MIAALLVGTAHAERRWNSVATCAMRTDNAGRVELGAGLMGDRGHGEVRLHVHDQATLGVRVRADRDAVLALEGEVGWSLGRGKMVFPGPTLGRTDLYVRAGAGAGGFDGQTRGLAFGGLAWRFYPVKRLAIDLAVRELWAAQHAEVAFRGASPPVRYGWSTELGFTIALVSRERMHCRCR